MEGYENIEVLKARVVDELRANGPESPLVEELLASWHIAREQEVAVDANDEGDIKLHIEEAELFSEAGLAEDALDLYYEVLDHAEAAGQESLCERIRMAIATLL
jgi:hypothetical protein